MGYGEYLAEKLDSAIQYSEYLAEKLDNNIAYAEYIAESLSTVEDKRIRKREIREKKLKRIFNDQK